MSYEIKMRLNGSEFNPTSDDGAALRPIIYNGSSYLPVRTLCDAVGVKVEWDGANKTIWLGEKGEKIKIGKEVMNTDSKDREAYYTENPDLLYLGEKLYERGIRWKNSEDTRYFAFQALEGKMAKLGGTIYLEKAPNRSSSIGKTYNVRFRSSNDDGKETLAIYNVISGVPFDFEVDLNSANMIVLEISYDDNEGFSSDKETINFSLLDLYYKN